MTLAYCYYYLQFGKLSFNGTLELVIHCIERATINGKASVLATSVTRRSLTQKLFWTMYLLWHVILSLFCSNSFVLAKLSAESNRPTICFWFRNTIWPCWELSFGARVCMRVHKRIDVWASIQVCGRCQHLSWMRPQGVKWHAWCICTYKPEKNLKLPHHVECQNIRWDVLQGQVS